MAGCVENLCLQCCAMFLSVIYFMSGVACFILGVFVTAGDITDDLKHININKPFAVLSQSSFIVGGAFFFLGFIGIVIHVKGKQNLLMFYNSLVMFVSLLLLVATFILLSIGKTELLDRFANETIDSMRYYGDENPDLRRLTDTWNSWQSNLLCCGYHDKDDWLQVTGTIPDTCCRDIYIGCVESASPGTDDIHEQGCGENFIIDIKDFVNGLFIVVLVYSGIMILIMLATLCTLCDCDRENEDKLSTPI